MFVEAGRVKRNLRRLLLPSVAALFLATLYLIAYSISAHNDRVRARHKLIQPTVCFAPAQRDPDLLPWQSQQFTLPPLR
jgi:hypothetical protein